MGRNVHEIYKKRRIEFFCNALDRGIRALSLLTLPATVLSLSQDSSQQFTILKESGRP